MLPARSQTHRSRLLANETGRVELDGLRVTGDAAQEANSIAQLRSTLEVALPCSGFHRSLKFRDLGFHHRSAHRRSCATPRVPVRTSGFFTTKDDNP